MKVKMAAARMMMIIRGVKARKMVGAGLIGYFSKIRPFCSVPPVIAVGDQGGIGIVVDEETQTVADEGGIGTAVDEEKLKREVSVWKLDPVAEELAAARRQRKTGYPTLCRDAAESEEIKELAIVGLDQINQREHTNLQLVRVLGAWRRPGRGVKHDITLEATDGGGKGKFYRVAVNDLYWFIGYKKLELVHWVLLDHPSPPIIPFEPGTYSDYIEDLDARLESLCKARPPVTNPNTNWYSGPNPNANWWHKRGF